MNITFRKTALACLLALLAIPARADEPANTLTDAEKQAGWKLLFDGKTTDGWRNYQKQTISPGWKVIDGILTCSGKGAGDIITTDQYDNFELQIDFRIAKGGNSGIYYRCDESAPTGWQTGVEVQLLDNGKSNPLGLHQCGAAYELYGCTKDVVKPAGEWNHIRLVLDGKHVEHWINGEKAVEYDLGSDDFNARVAKSKFKNPKFAKLAKGHLALQDHGSVIEFRNVKVRTLAAK